jgi:hypothetical protein
MGTMQPLVRKDYITLLMLSVAFLAEIPAGH